MRELSRSSEARRHHRIIIAGGRVIDPATGIDGPYDVSIEDGVVAAVGKNLAAAKGDKDRRGAVVFDAKGRLVFPGLIDLHVHLREPGREDEETIATGCRAAAVGGFTSIVSMANTNPAVDSASVVDYVSDRAKEVGLARVFPVGAVTKGLKGEELAEMGELARAGSVAFSDDGETVMDAELMRRAFEYSRMFARPIISHAEDKRLTAGGHMHEGKVSTRLGLTGMPSSAEETIVARDIILAESAGAALHVAHVSCRRSVELVREAKKRGVKVTAEVTPHHLSFCDEDVVTFNTSFKMNPPLRTAKDRKALRAGVEDGTIDAIATDHAPHSEEEKEVEFAVAPFGTTGLETAFSAVFTLAEEGVLSLARAIAALTCGPASVLGLPHGTLAVGSPADVTVIDPKAYVEVDPRRFQSKSRNSAFAGRRLKGLVTDVMVDGRWVVTGGALAAGS